MMGKLWGQASATVKQPFQDKSEKLRAVRDKKMEEYKLTPEYANFQKQNQSDGLIRKFAKQLGVNKKHFKSFPSDPKAPKRPSSSFFLYANDVRSDLQKKNPDMSIGDIGKKIGADWKNMSGTAKGKYEKLKHHQQYLQIRAEYDAEKKASGKSTVKK